MKDPTRGGLAAALNEMARKSQTCIEVEESAIPVRDEARALADLDRHLAVRRRERREGGPHRRGREGVATRCSAALRSHPLGQDAALIGEVTSEYRGRVVLSTASRRPPLPRDAARGSRAEDLLGPGRAGRTIALDLPGWRPYCSGR